LIAFILSLVSNGKEGTDTQARLFFKQARRIGLLDKSVKSVGRDTISKARKKLHWTVFRILFDDVVQLSRDVWPNNNDFNYKGLSVYAIDGSQFTLPASKELREDFDPESGFEYSGKGHFPQCLVSTIYDVFRRIPIARSIAPINSSEREEAQKLIPSIPHGLLVFDRGYPSYEIFLFLQMNYSGFFLFRSPTSNTFPVVEQFISSRKKEIILLISPSKNYKAKVCAEECKKLRPIAVRALKVKNDAGQTIVLLTNLFDKKRHPIKEIEELYRARWGVESHYRDEKVTCQIEQFHSRNSNGIRQEILASGVMSVIARILMVLSGNIIPYQHSLLQDNPKFIEENDPKKTIKESQFAHAIKNLCNDAAALAADNPEIAFKILREVAKDIREVCYYRQKTRRPSQPRVNKSSPNKWMEGRQKKIKEYTRNEK